MPRKKDYGGLSKVIYFRVPEEVHKELEGRAKKRWMNLSAYMRELVREILEEEEEMKQEKDWARREQEKDKFYPPDEQLKEIIEKEKKK